MVVKLLKAEGVFGICSCLLEGKPTECQDFFLGIDNICDCMSMEGKNCCKLNILFLEKKGIIRIHKDSDGSASRTDILKKFDKVEAVTKEEMEQMQSAQTPAQEKKKPETYLEVADEVGLQGNKKERFLKYMQTRWADDEKVKCLTGYAKQWAESFKAEVEFEMADAVGQEILKKI